MLKISRRRPKKIDLSCYGALGCVHPHSIFNDRVLLFYTPYPPEEKELPYLAVSNDGVSFVPTCNGPLLNRGSWDSHHLADVDVLRAGDRWLLYYAGASLNGEKRVSIGVAEGDGMCEWRKLGIALTHGRVATTPTVIRLGEKYIMYYATYSSRVQAIWAAESVDGVKFEPVGEVLAPFSDWNSLGINHPHASLLGDKVILLFVGYDGRCFSLGYAIMNQGDPYKPVLVREEPLLTARDGLPCRLELMRGLRRRLRYFYSLTMGLANRIPLPWRGLHFYRSSFLTTPDRKILKRDGKALLYVSSYDWLLGIPHIGLYEVLLVD